MSPEQWQHIETILDKAVALAPDERIGLLDRACAGDEALREQVEALLDSLEQAEADDFLGASPFHGARNLMMGPLTEEVRDVDLEADQTVGAYRIVGPLGRGGMGVVYLAERADGQFHKRVALKVVKRGMDTHEILLRFRNEREILARLEHPNIARLLDAGVTDDGRPYFAMECVEGEPIDTYCDRKQLSIRERLALFQTVCEAVQYAHRNLVVHRDLKPSNVLVSKDGEAKLLDFGIAKLLKDDLSLGTVSLTEVSGSRMTPSYAAPEQVIGAPTTPATDVYALGVMLYELTTGRRPYRFDGRSLAEVARVVCQQVPEKPSTVALRPVWQGDAAPTAPETLSQKRAVPPKLLRRQLQGDLDAIVLMALRKEPERRYASAGAFADDVGRYLRNHPVVAQHDTVGYRTAKFVQRHKVAVTAATFAFLALLVGFVAAAWQANVAGMERDRAAQEAARAISTREFMVGTFALADPDAVVDPSAALDQTFTKQDLIEANLSRIDELRNPLDQAIVLNGMARAYLSYGAFEKADSLYHRALGMKVSALGEGHLEVAKSLHGLALVAINQGRVGRADSLLRRALEIRRTAWDDAHLDLLVNVNDLGYMQLWQNRWPEAETLYRDGLAMATTLEAGASDATRVQVYKANSLDGLARARQEQGDLYVADSLFRQSLAIRRKVLGERHPQTANTMHELGMTLKKEGDLTGAAEYLERASTIYRQFYGDEHVAVAVNTYEQGRLYHDLGAYDKARALYLEAIDTYQNIFGPMYRWRANPLMRLGQLLLEQDDAAGALSSLREGLAVCRANKLPDEHPLAVQGTFYLGVSLTRLGQHAAAEERLRAVYQALQDAPARQAVSPADALRQFVALYEAWGKPAEAETYRAMLKQRLQNAPPVP